MPGDGQEMVQINGILPYLRNEFISLKRMASTKAIQNINEEQLLYSFAPIMVKDVHS